MSDIRTRPATREYRDGFDAIDWSDGKARPVASEEGTAPCPSCGAAAKRMTLTLGGQAIDVYGCDCTPEGEIRAVVR